MFQRRHPVAGFPIGVLYKFGEDQGPYLAALITYYGFLSLFPLLLLLTSVLGFVLDGQPELQRRILDSTLSQFPVIGDEIADPQGLQGSVGAIIVGGLVALYGALGVAQAIQNTMNVTWSVPRNRRPNPINARLRSLRLIGLVGIAIVTTTILSGAGSSPRAFGADVRGWSTVAAIILSILVNAAVLVVTFRIFRPDKVRRATSSRERSSPLSSGSCCSSSVLSSSATSSRTRAPPTACSRSCSACWRGSSSPRSASSSDRKSTWCGPTAVPQGTADTVHRQRRSHRRRPARLLDAVSAQQFKGFQSVTVHYEDDGQRASARRALAQSPVPADDPDEPS